MGRMTLDPAPPSVVVPCTVNAAHYEKLRADTDESNGAIKVWANSELTLLSESGDLAGSVEGPDYDPFRAPVSISEIRRLLGVEAIWRKGFRRQNVVVGVVDNGVDGRTYPVRGGYSRPSAVLQYGAAPVTSHGSMCASDVLIAAPDVTLYDYPFLGIPRSGGALQIYQAILNQRQIDSTPHITTNSYGITNFPDRNSDPSHEVHDINHPLHRKIREVVHLE